MEDGKELEIIDIEVEDVEPERTRTDYTKEFKRKMRLQYCVFGKTLKAIAKEFDIKYRTLSGWSSKGNWSLFARQHQEQQNEAVLEYSFDMIELYKELLDELQKDLLEVEDPTTGEAMQSKFRRANNKEKKFFVDCVKVIDDSICKHLYLTGDE